MNDISSSQKLFCKKFPLVLLPLLYCLFSLVSQLVRRQEEGTLQGSVLEGAGIGIGKWTGLWFLWLLAVITTFLKPIWAWKAVNQKRNRRFHIWVLALLYGLVMLGKSVDLFEHSFPHFRILQILDITLACLGCHNKIPQTDLTIDIYFSQFWMLEIQIK